jgi:hypothetical protein
MKASRSKSRARHERCRETQGQSAALPEARTNPVEGAVSHDFSTHSLCGISSNKPISPPVLLGTGTCPRHPVPERHCGRGAGCRYLHRLRRKCSRRSY